MEIATQLLIVLGYSLVAISLIPLVRKDNWFFRIFEYPRAQKLIINLIILGLFVALADWGNMHHRIFACVQTLNLFYLIYQIWPYTFFGKHQLGGAEEVEDEKQFSLLIFNVYQDNRDVRSCLDAIAKEDPHLILLVETDAWWKQELDKALSKNYRYQLGQPLSNTYGMMLYSKLQLAEGRIRYLIDQEVPSIEVNVMLPSGDVFKLYGLHPQPPVPQENPRSTERDAEILLVGKEAKKCHLPVVVAGDLNDVAWSYTTELFMKVSGLLDPRRGRGFYNTFHARHWFLRWPLDHIFCSQHFQLISMKRLPAMGSDHFAMLVSLLLNDEESQKARNRKLSANAEEEKMAQRKVKKGLRQHS